MLQIQKYFYILPISSHRIFKNKCTQGLRVHKISNTTTSSRIFSSKMKFFHFFLALGDHQHKNYYHSLMPWLWFILRHWSFTLHCFGIISANADRVKRANVLRVVATTVLASQTPEFQGTPIFCGLPLL